MDDWDLKKKKKKPQQQSYQWKMQTEDVQEETSQDTE